MVFDDADVPTRSEPIRPDQLKTGEVYWAIRFVDQAMSIPSLEPRVFIGRDLEKGDRGLLYFQDAQSYFNGAGTQADGHIVTVDEIEATYLFDFDSALERLRRCRQQRK